ncbi:PucR family transcriptional regulator [Salinibacterium sp. M195]|uniref:PucR family transcriptional regulator n=1 Tax=Salinibacterium sp. M195 TaxID=2583374 RepID=UPI001C633E95|nr:PucR family transcriptional regulator [Salinibacterium sp. M195]QYH34686.1 PucR family transcriptional regulator [Salinibacterium sp. M195]
MLPTIAWLLGRQKLRLSVVGNEGTNEHPQHRDRLKAPISWVHSSDLADPTPFLSSGNVLLTDGAQFGFDAAAELYDYDAYVARLVTAGVVGLGFATHFLHQGMPPGLAEACEIAGLPLIDVPDRVPFIAVIREVADQIAAERNRRMEWSISAHKAISRAALRPTGLRSTLVELERQLSCWVGLFDATGAPLLVPSQRLSDDRFAAPVRDEVAQALRKGRRSSTSLTLPSGQVTIQTLGHSGELRGALALGRGVPLDRAENELVTSVIALATLALEQNRELDTTRGQLRSALLELLLAGNVSAARATAVEVWGALPAEPLTVVSIARQVHSHFVLDALEALALDGEGRVFFAERDNTIVVIVGQASDLELITQLVADHKLSAGSAVAADYATLDGALEQASHALHAAAGGAKLIEFGNIADTGMLGVLHSAGAEQVAHRVLTPLTHFDAEHSAALVQTLRSWFAHDCSWGATAVSLGVHRHTVRSRVDQAASILSLDLESFEGRLEVWAALRMLP